jgi:hypothetical protein
MNTPSTYLRYRSVEVGVSSVSNGQTTECLTLAELTR